MKIDFYKSEKLPLAFYAWTDTLILNATKIKIAYFPDQKADLFILKLPRISTSLVFHLKNQHIFQNILWVEVPFSTLSPIKRKFSKLIFTHQYKASYFAQLKRLSKQYSLLFTGALWSDTILLFQYLKQYSPILKIQIMEEGTANYCGLKTIVHCDPLSTWKDKIIRRTRCIGIYKNAVQAIIGMFLSCPEGYLGNRQDPIYPILGHESPAFFQLLSNCTAGLVLDEYRSRKVIFFLQPEREVDFNVTLQLIQVASLVVGPQNIIIRPHPDSGDMIIRLKRDLPSEIYLETMQFPFEYVLYSNVWRDQILISKGSSCLFYPCYILREEPIVIFTNQLYAAKRGKATEMTLLIERLKKIYTDSERVLCPETIAEFRNSLKRN